MLHVTNRGWAAGLVAWPGNGKVRAPDGLATSGFPRGRSVDRHRRADADVPDGQLAVDMRVRVHPGTDAEIRGVVVEDFGVLLAQPVDLGGGHVVGPARRWAVFSDTGDLVFADTDQLVAE